MRWRLSLQGPPLLESAGGGSRTRNALCGQGILSRANPTLANTPNGQRDFSSSRHLLKRPALAAENTAILSNIESKCATVVPREVVTGRLGDRHQGITDWGFTCAAPLPRKLAAF